MNVTTCYRCPERHPEPFNRRKRCPILQAKLDCIQGAGLTSIAFRCDRRPKLFGPGEIIRVELCVGDDRGNTKRVSMRAYVMRASGRKFTVFAPESDRGVIRLYPDGFERTGERVRACIHCGGPEGVKVWGRTKDGEYEWQCSEFLRDGDGFPTVPAPCVFDAPEAQS